MDSAAVEDEFDRLLREEYIPDNFLRAADALEEEALGSSSVILHTGHEPIVDDYDAMFLDDLSPDITMAYDEAERAAFASFNGISSACPESIEALDHDEFDLMLSDDLPHDILLACDAAERAGSLPSAHVSILVSLKLPPSINFRFYAKMDVSRSDRINVLRANPLSRHLRAQYILDVTNSGNAAPKYNQPPRNTTTRRRKERHPGITHIDLKRLLVRPQVPPDSLCSVFIPWLTAIIRSDDESDDGSTPATSPVMVMGSRTLVRPATVSRPVRDLPLPRKMQPLVIPVVQTLSSKRLPSTTAVPISPPLPQPTSDPKPSLKRKATWREEPRAAKKLKPRTHLE
ncbi:hypothetical protein B0H17DRAFT_1215816 [Mycena rosella]|uniref:Uncharacterized protein n=1 Tax=Mycena rosella TaxID=1033263 RepID=A0AAD7FY94_MYCRO|nr:hypothetical protein B0H17DRAFT_1215816 [Mycena rosella]